MEPGRDLDKLVAQKVMGWEWMGVAWRPPGAVLGQYRSFNPSQSASDSEELLEKLESLGWLWLVKSVQPFGYICELHSTDPNKVDVRFAAEKPKVAVCRASLRAMS